MIVWTDAEAVLHVGQPAKTGRHSFNGGEHLCRHRPPPRPQASLTTLPFLDIRRGVGATCSLVTRYLTEQEIGYT